MRRLAVPLAVLALTGCPSDLSNGPPPASRFFYPTGLVHADVAGSAEGTLFVANANFNKLYASGSIAAVNLDRVGLPAFGAPVDGGPLNLLDLGDAGTIQVNSFSGELAALTLRPGKLRLFTPSRSEGMRFQAVDATFVDGGVALSCFPAAPADRPTDCGANAPTMAPPQFEQTTAGVPRAVAPFGVAVQRRACGSDAACGAGRSCSGGYCLTDAGEAFADTWVTHLIQSDSPLGSGLNFRGYVVRVESDVMAVDEASFINGGPGSTTSVVAGKSWVYITGRFVDAVAYPYPNLLRYAQYTPAGVLMAASGLEQSYAVQDARGIALSSDESRLYVLTRSPDVLLVLGLDLSGPAPVVRIVRAVPLPFLPNEALVIPRPGRGDLVAVTCSGAGVVALYDEDLGGLAAEVTSVGAQPFGLAADRRGAGARLFVSDFADGRVAVIDIPNLARPADARIVAFLGEQQTCLTQVTPLASCPSVNQ